MWRLNKVLFNHFFIIFLVQCKSKDYCSSRFCNNSKQHTLCKFKSDDPASTCLSYERTVFNAIDRQRILDKINNRRNKVAAGEIRSLPSAAGMMKLKWNPELELSAQRWADQCVKHGVPDLKDTCRDLENMPVGQNIATVQGDSPGLTPVALVDVWYMELLKLNSSIISRFVPSFELGESHYDYFTQLVWEDSTQVGCGGVKFQETLAIERYRTVYRLVCNFAPAGNVRNKTVYSCGAPCSACSDGVCDKHYKALCEHKLETNYVDTKTDIYDDSETTETSNMEYIANRTISEAISAPVSNETEQESLPFDFIHNLYESNPIVGDDKITVTKDDTNKEDLLNDFIELLKKKLNKDVLIKNLLSTTSPESTETLQISFNDENVAAFVNRIYSTNKIYIPIKTTPKDYVNSTLLVDLIEAVIFRSNDKISVTSSYETHTQPLPVVKPVKIQAELGEVKQNKEFTGHYFFPEEDVASTEVEEFYYDNTALAQSDVELEIENLKMSSVTADFLDDIFDLESSTETTTIFNTIPSDNIMYKNRYGAMKKFLKRIQEKAHESYTN